MLKENTLFGLKDKVQIAMNRLRKYYPKDKGYYVAFSGGKDSVVILDLIKRSGLKYDAHYNNTTVDPPELVHFIRKEHSEVKFNQPEKTMWQYIVEKGPPLRQARWCCAKLKERCGRERTVVTGVRWEESTRRKARGLYEQHNRDKTVWFLNLIIDWTMLDVWDYIEQNNVKYCSLYDEGYDRLGCVLCPMTRTYKQDIKRWPKIVMAWKRAFKRFWDRKISEGSKAMRWENFEEFWNWWIGRDTRQVDLNQIELFSKG